MNATANEMMYSLKKWIHPKTGQVRIYVNPLWSGLPMLAKVWLEEGGPMGYTVCKRYNSIDEFPGVHSLPGGYTPWNYMADQALNERNIPAAEPNTWQLIVEAAE